RMFNTAGVLFWMYSDCWGTTGAWTVVDYYLRLKPSYYFVKRVFEPIHISIKEQDIVEIVAVNETYKSQEVEVEYGIEDFNGRILERKSERVELPGAKSLSIGKLDVSGIKEKDYVFVYAKVSSLEGGLISKNRIFLVDFKDLKLPEAKIDIKLNKIDVERYELSLTSDRFVWMVSIDVPDGISLSDNYFDIFPGEEIKLSVKALEEVDLYDIKVYTLNDIRRRYY
ncbi:MAG: glycoside hydrolase family 2 protein, partial [bacterium]